MERLSGLDASFLYNETPTLHMHTLKVSILDMSTVPGGYDFERFRQELERRLHLLPPFRRRVVFVPGGLHHPVWIEDPGFDLAYHVRRVRVPPPGRRQEMDEVIGEIASWPLDRSRPLWEIWMLEGLEDGKVGFLAKMHHTLADGVAAAALLANVMSASADDLDPPAPTEPWEPEAVPGRWQLIRDAVVDVVASTRRLPSLLRRTVPALRSVLRHRREATVSAPRPMLDTPRTPFNGALTPHRSFATATLPLADVKAVRAAVGVTVNDVVLGLVGGALRGWLADRGKLPERSLVAGVPVSTDDPEEMRRLGGNHVSNLFTSLGSHIADPVERLHHIHEITREAKVVHNLLGADTLADWSEYTPPRPYAWFMGLYGRWHLANRHRPPINLVVSNVPGPRDPLYVAGARLDSIFSVGPIVEGVGLNITVWSYLDQLNVGVIACREQVRDPHEITARIGEELADLVVRAEVLAARTGR